MAVCRREQVSGGGSLQPPASGWLARPTTSKLLPATETFGDMQRKTCRGEPQRHDQLGLVKRRKRPLLSLLAYDVLLIGFGVAFVPPTAKKGAGSPFPDTTAATVLPRGRPWPL